MDVGKFLRALDALRMKVENFLPSVNVLEETPYVLFVTIVVKTCNKIPSIVASATLPK